jgi:hypothetical protein
MMREGAAGTYPPRDQWRERAGGQPVKNFRRAFFVVALAAAGGSGPAAAQMSIQGFAPAGTPKWSVFSCVVPMQAPICIVPVKVEHIAGSACRFDVANVIELDSSKTFRIHWQLRSTDPTPNRRFVFGHSQGMVKDGIVFTQDFDSDFRDDNSAIGDKFGKQFRRFQKLDRYKLFSYDINVEFFDSIGGPRTQCDPEGPIIINRG